MKYVCCRFPRHLWVFSQHFKRLRSIHKGQFTLSTQLILLIDPVILSHRRSSTVSPETCPLYIAKPLTNPFPNTADAFASRKEKDKVSFFDSKVMLLANSVWGKKKFCLSCRKKCRSVKYINNIYSGLRDLLVKFRIGRTETPDNAMIN